MLSESFQHNTSFYRIITCISYFICDQLQISVHNTPWKSLRPRATTYTSVHLEQHWFNQLIPLLPHICVSELNQCWHIVNWGLRNKVQCNSNQNTKLFIHEHAFEKVVCEMVVILSKGRWLDFCRLNRFQHHTSYSTHSCVTETDPYGLLKYTFVVLSWNKHGI